MCLTPPDGWWESANRIAVHCAATHPSPPYLTREERADAALDSIVQYVHDRGWPSSDLHPVFQAGSNGIDRATYERAKHAGRGHYWVEPPGMADALGENITDRIGVWQLCWAFTPAEWAAIWALAEVMKHGGGCQAAASLLGITESALAQRLMVARQRAAALWIAPGETPRRRYYASNSNRPTRYQTWQYNRARRAA